MIGVLGFPPDKYTFPVSSMSIKKSCIMIQGNAVYSSGCKVGALDVHFYVQYIHVSTHRLFNYTKLYDDFLGIHSDLHVYQGTSIFSP